MVEIFCAASNESMKKVRAWLIPSLMRQSLKEQITLYIINYQSSDPLFADGEFNKNNFFVKELVNNHSMGFGESHNFAFEQVKPSGPFVIVNPDVYLHQDCLSNAQEEWAKKIQSDKIGLMEFRQLPFEHPKAYDVQTGHVPWVSGFGIFVNPDFFSESKGFDNTFWMYCEDVDLSWRAWILGYSVLYAPMAVGYHMTGAHFTYNKNIFYLEHFWSARNFLVLARKFFGKTGEKNALQYITTSGYPKNFIREVLDSYQSVLSSKDVVQLDRFYVENKHKINLCDKIKITGFNQYHRNSSYYDKISKKN